MCSNSTTQSFSELTGGGGGKELFFPSLFPMFLTQAVLEARL